MANGPLAFTLGWPVVLSLIFRAHIKINLEIQHFDGEQHDISSLENIFRAVYT